MKEKGGEREMREISKKRPKVASSCSCSTISLFFLVHGKETCREVAN